MSCVNLLYIKCISTCALAAAAAGLFCGIGHTTQITDRFGDAWMWVIAIIGSASAFVESTLAQIFKKKGKDGFYGGPSYYIEAAELEHAGALNAVGWFYLNGVNVEMDSCKAFDFFYYASTICIKCDCVLVYFPFCD